MTCCSPYECGVWHPAAQVPTALTPLGWDLPPFSGVKAALGVARYPLFLLFEDGAAAASAEGCGGSGMNWGQVCTAVGSGCPASFPTPADHETLLRSGGPRTGWLAG